MSCLTNVSAKYVNVNVLCSFRIQVQVEHNTDKTVSFQAKVTELHFKMNVPIEIIIIFIIIIIFLTACIYCRGGQLCVLVYAVTP